MPCKFKFQSVIMWSESYQLSLMIVHQDGIRDCNQRLPHPQGLKEAARASMTNDELSLAHVGFEIGCIFEDFNVKPVSNLTVTHTLAKQLVWSISSVTPLQKKIPCLCICCVKYT